MITLNTTLLKAANMVTGKDPIRPYLQGVFLEITPEEVIYVATDGHRLVAFREDAQWLKGAEPKKINMIIPFWAVSELKPTTKHYKAILEENDDGNFSMTHLKSNDSVTTSFPSLGYQYPDWRRVVPLETSGELTQFNADYLASFKKMGRLLGASESSPPVIHHNGLGPAIIYLGTLDCLDYVAVIMPMRTDFGDEQNKTTTPSWAHGGAK
jgi:hypothetical protein